MIIVFKVIHFPMNHNIHIISSDFISFISVFHHSSYQKNQFSGNKIENESLITNLKTFYSTGDSQTVIQPSSNFYSYQNLNSDQIQNYNVAKTSVFSKNDSQLKDKNEGNYIETLYSHVYQNPKTGESDEFSRKMIDPSKVKNITMLMNKGPEVDFQKIDDMVNKCLERTAFVLKNISLNSRIIESNDNKVDKILEKANSINSQRGKRSISNSTKENISANSNSKYNIKEDNSYLNLEASKPKDISENILNTNELSKVFNKKKETEFEINLNHNYGLPNPKMIFPEKKKVNTIVFEKSEKKCESFFDYTPLTNKNENNSFFLELNTNPKSHNLFDSPIKEFNEFSPQKYTYSNPSTLLSPKPSRKIKENISSFRSPVSGRIIEKVKMEDDKIFEGDTQNGIRQGYGLLKNSKGKTIYCGDWKDNLFDGHGCLENDSIPQVFNPNYFQDFLNNSVPWTKYEGKFTFGCKDGMGSMYFSNGEKFIGEFSNDYPHGDGCFFGNNGLIMGKWNKGILIKE